MNLTNIKRQCGVALISSLVIVLVISILGIGIARQVIAQRKVSSSNYDQTVIFIDAESGLAQAEALIEANSTAHPARLSATDANSVVEALIANDTWWHNDNIWRTSAAAATNAGTALHGQPRYLIEDAGVAGVELGKAAPPAQPHYFRVTARAQRAAGAVSFVQSYYSIMEQ